MITMLVALLSIGAQAQEKGDFAIGLHTGITSNKFEIEGLHVKETTTQFGLGAFGQYNLSKHWRTELEGIYHFKKNSVSDFQVGLNFHYLFNIGEVVRIYPLLGYALCFVHQDEIKDGNVTIEADNDVDGGIQLGAGLQVNITDNWFATGEYRWQPGIFGDGNVFMLGVGYRF